MALKNATLAALLVTLLATKSVESAGEKRKPENTDGLALTKSELELSPFLASSTLPSMLEALQVSDTLTRPRKKERKNKESLSTPLVDQSVSSVPVEVEDSFAHTPEGQRFMHAIVIGDIVSAFHVFTTCNEEQEKRCVKYLVSLEGSKLVDLITDATSFTKKWMLQVILVHANDSLCDYVFDGIQPSSALLAWVADSVELACDPERFTFLLNRFNRVEELERAVKRGVSALFAKNKTECLDPLLSVLREGTFLGKDLEDIAIRGAFHEASSYQDDRALIAERIYEDSAITAKDYSNALRDFYIYGDKTKKIFNTLLAGADKQDLSAVRKSDYFSVMKLEFQQAVNQAFGKADNKTRKEKWLKERTQLTRETLGSGIDVDVVSREHFSEIIDLIAEY